MASKRKYDSGADSVLMSEEDYALTQKYKQDFAAAQQAGNQAGMQAAHDAAEALREQYNYSGGADGSEYISLGKQNQSATAKLPSRAEAMEEFSYESAPSWISKYQEQIDALTQEILGRPEFSYDPESDPRYQAFRKEYQREGQRATADTLGQMAAMTGGIPSTAAATAAQQAGDYYAAQMADRIPELYQLAYSMYQDEGSNMRMNLDMLTALEQGDYNQYLNLLAQYNTDRDFAYGVYADAWDRNYQLDRDQVNDTRYDMEWNYGVGRDELEDQRYEDETSWNREQYGSEQEYSRALEKAQTLAAAGDFSGYLALGYSQEEVDRLQQAYDQEQASRHASGGGSSGSGGGNSSGDGDSDVYARMYGAGIRSEGDAYAWLLASGYNTTQAGKLAGYFADWMENGGGTGGGDYESATVDMTSVIDLGYGPISEEYLAELEARGEIESYVEDGKIKFRRTGKESAGLAPQLSGLFDQLMGR